MKLLELVEATVPGVEGLEVVDEVHGNLLDEHAVELAPVEVLALRKQLNRVGLHMHVR